MRERDPRRDLLTMLQAVLVAVDGRQCVARHLRRQPMTGQVAVVALGKAAASMAQGALDVLGPRVIEGLVVTKAGHGGPSLARDPRFLWLEAGHPAPDARSLMAGSALLDFLACLPSTVTPLFLISGGASALVEVLADGVELSDLRRVNQWLLASGLPITAMNSVRRALSRIKGGRLARALGGRPAICLLLSDVPGDDPAIIGSGLLVPSRDAGLGAIALPDWMRALVQRAGPAPPPGDPMLAKIVVQVVAGNGDGRRAAARTARSLGYPVRVHRAALSGDAGVLGARLAKTVLMGPPGVQIWGGETTVRLPAEPGRGGRCQHLALAAARALAGASGVWMLAVGSDGNDGPTEEAGALVDGETCRRGEAQGGSADAALAAADAETFLEASGDLIHTGPTGTNVADFVFSIKIEGAF